MPSRQNLVMLTLCDFSTSKLVAEGQVLFDCCVFLENEGMSQPVHVDIS